MSRGRELIARRIARLFKPGDVVNLGIGLPTMVANYIPPDAGILLHSENGFIGVGSTPSAAEADKDLVNAGGQPVSIMRGGACFDSAMSFCVIRGGHLAATVLGALEVDEQGNLANWMVPGMGGAMDLVVGAKRVIIAMEHTTKEGAPKILKRCNLPLTAAGEVDLIVTELGVMEVAKEGIILRELAPGVSVADIQARTEAALIIPEVIDVMG